MARLLLNDFLTMEVCYVTSKFRHMALATVLALPALGGASAQVAQFENLDALESRVIGALGAEIGAPGGPIAPIDRRLRLARCPGIVEIDPPALGAIALRCQQIGWRLRVPIQRYANGGQTEKAPPVVRKGDPVELSVESGDFSVSTEAIAQEDGARGDRIRVKTDQKASVMIAEIIDGGRVRLPGYK